MASKVLPSLSEFASFASFFTWTGSLPARSVSRAVSRARRAFASEASG